MSLENVGKGRNLGQQSEITRAGYTSDSDEKKYQAAVEKARNDLDYQGFGSDELFKQAIDNNLKAFGATKTGREIRGENVWTDLVNGINNGINGVNYVIGSGLDAAFDNVVGNLVGLANKETGDILKNAFSGEDLSYIPDTLSDIALAMIPGFGVPLVVAKELVRNGENFSNLISGKNNLTQEALTDNQKKATLAEALLGLGLSAIPGHGGYKVLKNVYGKKATKNLAAKAEKEFGEQIKEQDKAITEANARIQDLLAQGKAEDEIPDALKQSLADATEAKQGIEQALAEAKQNTEFGKRFKAANETIGSQLGQFKQAISPQEVKQVLSDQSAKLKAEDQLSKLAKEANKAVSSAGTQGNYVEALRNAAQQAGVNLDDVLGAAGLTEESLEGFRKIRFFRDYPRVMMQAMKEGNAAAKESAEFANAPAFFDFPRKLKEIKSHFGKNKTEEPTPWRGDIKQQYRRNKQEELMREVAEQRPFLPSGFSSISTVPGIRPVSRLASYPRAIASNIAAKGNAQRDAALLLQLDNAMRGRGFIPHKNEMGSRLAEVLGGSLVGLTNQAINNAKYEQNPNAAITDFNSTLSTPQLFRSVLPMIFRPGSQIAKRGIPSWNGKVGSSLPATAIWAKDYVNSIDIGTNREQNDKKYEQALAAIQRR